MGLARIEHGADAVESLLLLLKKKKKKKKKVFFLFVVVVVLRIDGPHFLSITVLRLILFFDLPKLICTWPH